MPHNQEQSIIISTEQYRTSLHGLIDKINSATALKRLYTLAQHLYIKQKIEA